MAVEPRNLHTSATNDNRVAANDRFCVLKLNIVYKLFFYLVEACKQSNEDLSQSPMNTMNTNSNNEFNNVSALLNDNIDDNSTSFDNESSVHANDDSTASFKLQAADQFDISDDEPNMYVIYYKSFSFPEI